MSYSRKLALLFLGLIGAGTALLSLPGMTTLPLSVIDRLFMATSAVCVTGLATIDLSRDLTREGQAVLLLLIQLGALGIVMFASMTILTGRRLSLGEEDMLGCTVAVGGDVSFRQVIRSVIGLTLVIELAGAAALLPFWPDGTPLAERAWLSLFHAVSAFCNAGMSTFANNLEGFTGNLGLNVVIMLLIVLGGFGFINLREIIDRTRQRQWRWSQVSLFLKITLLTTVLLNGGGALILFAAEYDNGMAHLTLADKALAALLQAVTTRTAGFTTLPLTTLTDFSLLIMMILMFIGGASGSTAGGIKTTTIAVIFATIISYVRNLQDPELFGRRLPAMAQRKAFVLATLAVVAIVAGVAAVYGIDAGLTSHADSGPHFLTYVFEVVSALGTVGLSLGITAGLADGSKLALILLMFVGRVGPLLMVDAWLARPQPRRYTSPQEGVPVG
jgi:trk system potassium uptake protein TrkH